MKRIVTFIFIVACLSFPVFAEAKTGEGSVTVENSADLIGSKATLSVGFDNSSVTDVEIGFASKKPASITEDMTGSVKTSIDLIRVADNTIANYGADTGNPLYLYWKIISGTALKLTLSMSSDAATTSGALYNGSYELGWTVYKNDNNTKGDSLITVQVSGASNKIKSDAIVEHTPGITAGSVGGQQILIETADFSTAPVGSYSGTLTLTIESQGD